MRFTLQHQWALITPPPTPSPARNLARCDFFMLGKFPPVMNNLHVRLGQIIVDYKRNGFHMYSKGSWMLLYDPEKGEGCAVYVL